tara:strand:+ start:1026 stop:1253 length:228 start_codon:yes stop_codon:yes gene_type:complete
MMQIVSTEYKGDLTFLFEPRDTGWKRTLHYPINERAQALCSLLKVDSLSEEKAQFIHKHLFPLQFKTEEKWYETA